MAPAPRANPLQLPPDQRRQVLARHFLEVLEPIISSGEPFVDLSVERLIRAGGIARKTFYAYFADKGDLLQAMASCVIDDIAVGGESWWELPEHADQDDVREALRPAAAAYVEHRTIMRTVAEGSAYDPRVRSVYGSLMAEAIASLSAHLEADQHRGLAYAGLDPHQTAAWLIWMFERGLYQAVSADADNFESWLSTAAEIVWRTLYAGHR